MMTSQEFIDACPTGKEVIHGYFLGGDPRQFLPDEEMNTPGEMARWREACALWNLGERPQQIAAGCWNSGAGMGVGLQYIEELS